MRAAQAIAADGPPTAVMTLREIEEQADERHSRSVVDLAGRVAALMLTTGGSCADATAAGLQVCHRYGLASVHVDATFSSVLVSHHRGLERDANTILRTASVRTPDYARLSDLQQLLDRLPALELDEARSEFNRIIAEPRRYRRWVTTAAAAMLGIGVAVLLGGGWVEIALACLTNAAVDLVLHVTARYGLPQFFGQIAGAAVPTVTAVAVMALGESGVSIFAGTSPSIIVAAGIVALLAGLSVVNAAQDAIDGFLITAGARMFNVAVMTLGIVLGILVVLWGGDLLGLPAYLNVSTPISPSLVRTTVGSALIALGFALGSYTRLRVLVWATGLGVISWLVYTGVLHFGLGFGTAAGIAAVVAAFLAQTFAPRVKMASVGLITAGVIPLLPGSMVYRGLYGVVRTETLADATPALLELLGAAAVAIGIAMGVSLGTWLGRATTRRGQRTRFQRKALRHAATTEE